MGYIGSFGEEFMRAMARVGLAPSRKVRLHGLADDEVRRHGVGDKAVAAVNAAIEDDPALMLEILDEIRFREPLIRRFLEGRAAALRAQGAHVPAGYHSDGAQRRFARRDDETARGEPAPETPAGGHRVCDPHITVAAEPETNNTNGQRTSDTQEGFAVRKPGHAKRGLGTIAAIAPIVARGVLESTVIAGRRLGELTPREAMAFVAREGVEIAKARADLDERQGKAGVIHRICLGLDPDKRISAQISDEEAAKRASA